MSEQSSPLTPSRRTLLGAGALGVAGALAATGRAAADQPQERPFRARPRQHLPEQPNLLVILIDDLGYADLSSYGHPDIKTPNIDRLAASGVRFTDAYSGGAVCSPTRISLYTGRYPARIRGGLEEPISTKAEWNGIPLDHPTLASLIKNAGYDTALVGKWHCGFLPWFSPNKLGWDYYYGNHSGGIDYFSKVSTDGLPDLFENERPVTEGRYNTHVTREKAIDWLTARERRSKPWLLNLNFTSPHWPWEGPDDKAVSDEVTAKARAGDPTALMHNDGGSLETYKIMVEDVDKQVGLVLDALKRTGQHENTVVFLASDNGGERFSYNWPFSGNKASTYEGGIRVPTIVSWPGVIDPHQVSDAPVLTHDWTATFLEIAGTAPHPDYPLDGESFVGYLARGEKAPEHDLFWRTRNGRALRRGDFKYVKDGSTEKLFNLAVDAREQANLSAKEPELFADLKSAWEARNSELLPY